MALEGLRPQTWQTTRPGMPFIGRGYRGIPWPMNRMPEPGDLHRGFFIAPGRCFPDESTRRRGNAGCRSGRICQPRVAAGVTNRQVSTATLGIAADCYAYATFD
jgi:hypothetical protein